MVKHSAVTIWKVFIIFEQRVPCCHFTLDPADYVVGSEYTTVFLPLTPEIHINSYLYSLVTPRLSKLIEVIFRNEATTIKGRRIMNKGMESKFNLIFLEHPLDAGKDLYWVTTISATYYKLG